jgi:hypothetical protein
MNPAPVGQIPPHLQQQMVQQQPRIPPNMNAQQHLLYQQQQQQQQHQQQQQQQQQMLEDQKKLSDMIDGLNLLLSIRYSHDLKGIFNQDILFLFKLLEALAKLDLIYLILL